MCCFKGRVFTFYITRNVWNLENRHGGRIRSENLICGVTNIWPHCKRLVDATQLTHYSHFHEADSKIRKFWGFGLVSKTIMLTVFREESEDIYGSAHIQCFTWHCHRMWCLKYLSIVDISCWRYSRNAEKICRIKLGSLADLDRMRYRRYVLKIRFSQLRVSALASAFSIFWCSKKMLSSHWPLVSFTWQSGIQGLSFAAVDARIILELLVWIIGLINEFRLCG
jgi:hypothetical protein